RCGTRARENCKKKNRVGSGLKKEQLGWIMQVGPPTLLCGRKKNEKWAERQQKQHETADTYERTLAHRSWHRLQKPNVVTNSRSRQYSMACAELSSSAVFNA